MAQNVEYNTFVIDIRLGIFRNGAYGIKIPSKVKISFDESVSLWTAEDNILFICSQGNTKNKAISELLNAGNHALQDEDVKREVLEKVGVNSVVSFTQKVEDLSLGYETPEMAQCA